MYQCTWLWGSLNKSTPPLYRENPEAQRESPHVLGKEVSQLVLSEQIAHRVISAQHNKPWGQPLMQRWGPRHLSCLQSPYQFKYIPPPTWTFPIIAGMPQRYHRFLPLLLKEKRDNHPDLNWWSENHNRIDGALVTTWVRRLRREPCFHWECPSARAAQEPSAPPCLGTFECAAAGQSFWWMTYHNMSTWVSEPLVSLQLKDKVRGKRWWSCGHNCGFQGQSPATQTPGHGDQKSQTMRGQYSWTDRRRGTGETLTLPGGGKAQDRLWLGDQEELLKSSPLPKDKIQPLCCGPQDSASCFLSASSFPSSSYSRLLANLERPQTWSHLRTFVPAIPLVWQACPSDIHKAVSFSSPDG